MHRKEEFSLIWNDLKWIETLNLNKDAIFYTGCLSININEMLITLTILIKIQIPQGVYDKKLPRIFF